VPLVANYFLAYLVRNVTKGIRNVDSQVTDVPAPDGSQPLQNIGLVQEVEGVEESGARCQLSPPLHQHLRLLIQNSLYTVVQETSQNVFLNDFAYCKVLLAIELYCIPYKFRF
jgi:hypothetical protein